MNNLSKPFKLSDLIALQSENQTAQANLKTVTEIKLPEPLPAFRVKQVPPRYRLVVDGVEHLWTGRGRIPVEYQKYTIKHGYKGRDYLQALLIEGVQP
jgi:DNA-binding protein H-NS